MSGYGNSSGYGDLGNDGSSGYSNSGYGQPDGQSGYGGGGSEVDPGYGDSGYSDGKFDGSGDGTSATSLGAGNSPHRTRGFADGYRGNPFEVNQFDTPYSETAANPFPQGDGYAAAPSAPQVGRSRDRQAQADELPPMTPPVQPQGVVNAEPSKSASSPNQSVAKRKAPKRRTYSDDQLML